jgi:hypothetical protein
LATNAGPYGISVTQKFDVHYENSSVRKQWAICSCILAAYSWILCVLHYSPIPQ